MPWNKFDLRLNGLTSPLGSGGWVELTDVSVGYYGIASCTLVDKRIKHEAVALAKPNDLVEISIDGFATTLWKGRVSKYIPGGVADEGVTLHCSRLEDLLRRRTARWNLKPAMQYNQGLLTDVSSPSFDGTVSADHRWTLGEILIDVLEHAWGLNTPSRVGGPAGGPINSDIPKHHPDPGSVTNPYMSVVTPGPALDYLDQLVWDPAIIKALLNFRVPDVYFRDLDLWSLIEQIVQNAGEHGVFIDPTQITTPRLVVHKFSNSTLVYVQAGQRGVHAETPSVRLKQDEWEFDDQNVANLIVIQGTGIKGTTDPALPASHPLSGKMDPLDAAGKFWRVRNQDAADFLSGFEADDPRNMTTAELAEPRPLLYRDDKPYTTETAGWIAPGVCVLKTGITGDIRAKAMFDKPFQVIVGPNASSNTRYPSPSSFDAFGQFGLVKEMHISEPQFSTSSRKVEQEFPMLFTRPPTASLTDGKNAIVPVQRRKLDELGYPQFFLSYSDRDDTATMTAYAEEIQRRFRDISVKLTLTLDGIRLDELWSTGGTELGLRKKVSLLGLEGNRWSDAQLQVMSIRVNLPRNETIVECSSTIYNVTKLFPDIWKRRRRERKQDKQQQEIENLLAGDQLGDQGDPAPDGEPQKSGIRTQGHNSPAPRLVRYPGFRVHLVKITTVPGAGLGVYKGERIDELYEGKGATPNKIVKFFNPAETNGGAVLLKVDDVVHVYPVYRDSLSYFLGVDVEQDEAHVCISTAVDQFPARLTKRTAIANPGWGASALTAIFDWVAVSLKEDGVWVNIPGGAHGEYLNCTGAVEMQFTNHALEYGTKVVYLKALSPDSSSSSSASCAGSGGWSYVFDEAHTNVL